MGGPTTEATGVLNRLHAYRTAATQHQTHLAPLDS